VLVLKNKTKLITGQANVSIRPRDKFVFCNDMPLIKDLRQSNAAFAAGVFIISLNTAQF
jgi:hypothetical protein